MTIPASRVSPSGPVTSSGEGPPGPQGPEGPPGPPASQTLAQTLALGNTSDGQNLNLNNGGILQFATGFVLDPQSSISRDSKTLVYSPNNTCLRRDNQLEAAQIETNPTEFAEYVYGATANGTVRDRAFLITVSIGGVIFTIKYQVLCMSSDSGVYTDILTPIVAPDAYGLALAVSVTLIGATNARAIRVTNDSASDAMYITFYQGQEAYTAFPDPPSP